MINIFQSLLGNVANNNSRPLINIYGVNAYFFGDSITYGVGVTNAQRYTNLLCGIKNSIQQNKGVSNSVLESRSPTNPISGGVNMVSRISEIPTKTASIGLLCFFYGMNDWGYNGVNYTPENFITDYSTVIDAAFAKGWDINNVLLIGPSYPGEAAFTFYSAFTGNPAPTRAGMIGFVNAGKSVATIKNIRHLDLYAQMESNNPYSLLYTDQVHLNSVGHIFLKDQLLPYFY